MTQGDATGWRPGVVTSLTRFWVLSLLLVLMGGIVGFAAASAPAPKATATASLVLSDPGSTFASDSGTTHFADQVAIIKLASTASAAATLLHQRLPSAGLSSTQLQDELSVSAGTSNQLVNISVTDKRPAVALAGTTAVVDAYLAQANKKLTDNRNAALQNNQNAIDAIERDVNVTAPVAAQNQLALQALEQTRAQLVADPSAADGPYQNYSPAILPTLSRTVPPPVGLVGGLLLGLIAAMVVTRFLAQARQRFSGRFEPELIFSTPLLADVPSFASERLPSDLPVVDAATSSVAEAYRFATTAVRAGEAKIVAVVSAASSEGKSSCAANLAVTAAYQGASVLVIDADFEGKGVSFLFGQDFERRQGLLDVLDGNVDIDDVLVDVPFAAGLSLLRGGHAAGYDWPDVLSTRRWPQLAERLAARFDLIVIDLPPFLQIAYAVPIVRAADGVVVVIPHKSSVQRAAELAERLRFVGVESLGYLYVKAPLRKEVGLVSRLATDKDRRPTQRLPALPETGTAAAVAGAVPTASTEVDTPPVMAEATADVEVVTPQDAPPDPGQDFSPAAENSAVDHPAQRAGEPDPGAAAPSTPELSERPLAQTEQPPYRQVDTSGIPVGSDVLPAEISPHDDDDDDDDDGNDDDGGDGDDTDRAAGEPSMAGAGGVVRVSLLTREPERDDMSRQARPARAFSEPFAFPEVSRTGPALRGNPSTVTTPAHDEPAAESDDAHGKTPAEVNAGTGQATAPVRKQVHNNPRPTGSRKSRPRR